MSRVDYGYALLQSDVHFAFILVTSKASNLNPSACPVDRGHAHFRLFPFRILQQSLRSRQAINLLGKNVTDGLKSSTLSPPKIRGIVERCWRQSEGCGFDPRLRRGRT